MNENKVMLIKVHDNFTDTTRYINPRRIIVASEKPLSDGTKKYSLVIDGYEKTVCVNGKDFNRIQETNQYLNTVNENMPKTSRLSDYCNYLITGEKKEQISFEKKLDEFVKSLKTCCKLHMKEYGPFIKESEALDYIYNYFKDYKVSTDSPILKNTNIEICDVISSVGSGSTQYEIEYTLYLKLDGYFQSIKISKYFCPELTEGK